MFFQRLRIGSQNISDLKSAAAASGAAWRNGSLLLLDVETG
jgi:hypothetical protein